MKERDEYYQREFDNLMKLSITELEEKYRYYRDAKDLNYTGNSYSDNFHNANNRALNKKMEDLVFEVLSIKRKEKETEDSIIEENRRQQKNEEVSEIFKEIKKEYKREHPLRHLIGKIKGVDRYYNDYENKMFEAKNSTVKLEKTESEYRGYGR